MHGRSLAWVRDRCEVEGAGRALLYAIAAFADKRQGACTASYRTLATAAGMKPRWTVEMLRRFVDQGVVERLDPGVGRRPATHRIHPSLWRSGAVDAPQGEVVVVQSATRSGAVPGPVVVQSPNRSGAVPSPLTSTNGRQEKYVEEKSVEDSALRLTSPSGAGQTGSAGRADARPRSQPSNVEWSVLPSSSRGVQTHAWDWDAVEESATLAKQAMNEHAWMVEAIDPDADRLDNLAGWQLSDRYHRAWLPVRDVVVWYETQRAKLIRQRGEAALQRLQSANNPSPEGDRYLVSLLYEVEECSGGEWEGTAIRLPNGHLIDTVQAAKAFLASHPRGER